MRMLSLCRIADSSKIGVVSLFMSTLIALDVSVALLPVSTMLMIEAVSLAIAVIPFSQSACQNELVETIY